MVATVVWICNNSTFLSSHWTGERLADDEKLRFWRVLKRMICLGTGLSPPQHFSGLGAKL